MFHFSFKIIWLKIAIRSLGPRLIADKICYHWTTALKTICIGNEMISSAIWNKWARVNFSKTNKIARARRASAIWGLYKCLFNPNCTRKIMWLLVNNIHTVNDLINALSLMNASYLINAPLSWQVCIKRPSLTSALLPWKPQTNWKQVYNTINQFICILA